MEERKCQYETTQEVEIVKRKLNFKKGDNPTACGKYLNESHTFKTCMVILSNQITELKSVRNEVNKLKRELTACDQTLFDKSGRRLFSSKSVYHDYNISTIQALIEIEQEIETFTTHLESKVHLLRESLKGLLVKARSKSSKRKHNIRKAEKRKKARFNTTKSKVLEKILPLHKEGAMPIGILIEADDVCIEEVQDMS